ncbi:hypothetical protein ASPVEDRAFT_42324 [Aspergillus versicolor CBS 583.65]|uniref:Distal membrane-arm assembly complex protein 1-like domain-containing protein n=1 Tax=Aspergillus versicolor CBS 583.65 TaxID=1036611 RepID=A0A1L9PMV1_ASPVE|nr:uncharacterized protein ASPVEDRAFT_42324 [Aspergillus versicolor CBS 583.65]OJJ02812.1 hypothetical protein ASPVEDRAFT_42324 [Aspergillus versicolor CBS 583.65]
MASPTENNASDVQSSKAKPPIAYEEFEDCFTCRATGSAAFIGLGVYSYYTGMSNLQKQEQSIMRSATKYKMGSRRLGIATISAALVGVGVWRAFN